MMRILDTGIQSAFENMRLDRELLESLSEEPILHLYDWSSPSITHGHFIVPEKHLSPSVLEQKGISLARRPTGGGIVFHLWDYAFSFLMPSSSPLFSVNTLDNYRFVNTVVLRVMTQMFDVHGAVDLLAESLPIQKAGCEHFCMARPTQYDVVYQGRKIAGAAQRRTKRGYLHQGTISLMSPDMGLLSDLLLAKEDISQAMLQYAFTPLGGLCAPDRLRAVRLEVGKKLIKEFSLMF